MKCFLKKRLSGACRMDLKAEGGSQKDQLLLQQALEDPLSLQMHRSTLLCFLRTLVVLDFVQRGICKDFIL